MPTLDLHTKRNPLLLGSLLRGAQESMRAKAGNTHYPLAPSFTFVVVDTSLRYFSAWLCFVSAQAFLRNEKALEANSFSPLHPLWATHSSPAGLISAGSGAPGLGRERARLVILVEKVP